MKKKEGKKLGAAPGDVDAFVREVSDSAIVGIERAFERADLTVGGKPLGARVAGEWRYTSQWDASRYLWFARQFVRGAAGGFVPVYNAYRPEEVLGFDLWSLGRNVRGEIDAFETRNKRNVYERVMDDIRTRLNWPRLPDDYDPPPPSLWPKGELDGNEEGSSYSTWARRRFRK